MLKRCHTTTAIVCFLFTMAVHCGDCRAGQVRWASDIESALQTANKSNRLVLMKFTADWCGYCKKMEKTTFTDESVAGLVNDRFVPVLVDADEHKDLVTHLKIRGLPALLIVSPEMLILERITGYQTAEKLLPQLNQVLAVHQPTPHVSEDVADSHHAPTPTLARPVSRLTAPKQASETPFEASTFDAVVTGAPSDVAQPQPAAVVPFADSEPLSLPSITGRPEMPNPFAESHQTALPNAVTGVSSPAFGGLCLTSVIEERRLVAGHPEITATYRGHQLRFESEQQKQKFLSSPKKYWPMLDGACPLTLLQTGQRVTGELQHAAVFRGKIWLFQSPQLMQQFISTPADYVDQLR